MSEPLDINDLDLHAFLDGALDPERSRSVSAKIQGDPALAARLAGFEADKAMLKRVYGPLSDRPVPEQWLALARHPAPNRMWRMAGAIAAVLVLGAGVTAGYLAWRPAAGPREIVQAALYARDNSAGHFAGTSDPEESGRYDSAISKAIALRVKVPDLGKMGYRLAGVRLYPEAPGGSAAEIAYRDGAGRLFTLYLRRSQGAVRFDQFEQAGLRVCVWQDDQLGMVMTGNVSTAAMQRLASLAYTGLTL